MRISEKYMMNALNESVAAELSPRTAYEYGNQNNQMMSMTHDGSFTMSPNNSMDPLAGEDSRSLPQHLVDPQNAGRVKAHKSHETDVFPMAGERGQN